MIDPLSRIGVMDWAIICFQMVADFTNPVPAISLMPSETRTRGARFVALSEPSPGVFIARYELDSPLREEERSILTGVHVDGLSLAPFFPLTLTKIPDPPEADRFFEAIIIASDPPPPPGSDPVEVGYRYVLKRSIPA
jgi:hypothetical protein